MSMMPGRIWSAAEPSSAALQIRPGLLREAHPSLNTVLNGFDLDVTLSPDNRELWVVS
jgi:hypothetical protein